MPEPVGGAVEKVTTKIARSRRAFQHRVRPQRVIEIVPVATDADEQPQLAATGDIDADVHGCAGSGQRAALEQALAVRPDLELSRATPVRFVVDAHFGAETRARSPESESDQ